MKASIMNRGFLWKYFVRLEESASHIGLFVSVAFVFAAAIGITVATLCRYFFNYNIPGVDEWSGYMLVFVTYLGLSYGLKSNSHISVEFLCRRLPVKTAYVLSILQCLIALLVVFVFFYYALKTLVESIIQEEQALSLLQTPLWIPRSAICVGWIFFVFSLIRLLVERIMKHHQK